MNIRVCIGHGDVMIVQYFRILPHAPPPYYVSSYDKGVPKGCNELASVRCT